MLMLRYDKVGLPIVGQLGSHFLEYLSSIYKCGNVGHPTHHTFIWTLFNGQRD